MFESTPEFSMVAGLSGFCCFSQQFVEAINTLKFVDPKKPTVFHKLMIYNNVDHVELIIDP